MKIEIEELPDTLSKEIRKLLRMVYEAGRAKGREEQGANSNILRSQLTARRRNPPPPHYLGSLRGAGAAAGNCNVGRFGAEMLIKSSSL